MLIGGANEFCEYVNAYYGVQSAFSSQHLQQVIDVVARRHGQGGALVPWKCCNL